MENISEAMKTIPYFSRNNVSEELYEQLSKLRDVLMKRTADDCHQLNKGNVTGIWLLKNMRCCNNPQFILRSSVQRKTLDRMLLIGEIFDLAPHDIAYDYSSDVVKGEDEEVCMEIMNGEVLTIYDMERDGR